MVMPSTFTQSCEIIEVLSSKTNSAGANEEDDEILNWNLSGLVFMASLVNHSMARLRSDCRLDNTSDKHGGWYETVLSST